ncbi:hypothetical protein GALL_490710 [mine drainage metagenome]|uniref:Uncharacterized protein n=1 Tax=mine drainage metagenome TaxID=410659 RepID=A0A1J5PCH7_9ZZZZ
MNLTAGKARKLVVWIGNNVCTQREHAHVEAVPVVSLIRNINLALFPGQVLHALFDQNLGLRVQCQRHAQRPSRALAGMVIGGGTNATGRKHHIAAGKSPFQRGSNALG